MSTFARAFKGNIGDWKGDPDFPAVRALFERWALPGESSSDAKPLRFALRNGDANFYVKGQSVAKLSSVAGKPKISVHEAYVTGRKGSDVRGGVSSNNYQHFDACHKTAARIERWIETAETHACAEKRFVDDLVGANAGVIDLEMGLSTAKGLGAPRMDLVVAQVSDGGIPSIAFWEAKCATNKELRSDPKVEFRADKTRNEPKVIHQVSKYGDWINAEGCVDQVSKAYIDTAAWLLQSYDAYHDKPTGAAPACIKIWEALSSLDRVDVIAEPGVVIGNYWPEGCSEKIASGRMDQTAKRFAEMHRQRLLDNNIQIHEVGPVYSLSGDLFPHEGSQILPILPFSTVSA